MTKLSEGNQELVNLLELMSYNILKHEFKEGHTTKLISCISVSRDKPRFVVGSFCKVTGTSALGKRECGRPSGGPQKDLSRS